MATVDGLTKARMLAIEAESITAARLDGVTGHLILTKHDGTDIDVGSVIGPEGPVGPPGAPNPGTTVVGPDAFGDAPAVGASLDYSRKDHKHGLPDLPAGYLLGVHEYAPSVNVFYNAPGGNPLAAIDPANIGTGPFEAPASGVVLVKFDGSFFTNDGSELMLALFEHGTTTQVGWTITTVDPSVSSAMGFPTRTFRVGGLTPGTTYQFDLAWAAATGPQLNVRGAQGTESPAQSPFLCEVWAGL